MYKDLTLILVEKAKDCPKNTTKCPNWNSYSGCVECLRAIVISDFNDYSEE